MIKIGSLWKQETEKAGVYYSGKISLPVSILIEPGMKILLFKNKSETENSPDLDIMIAEKANGQKKQKQESSLDDEDIPF